MKAIALMFTASAFFVGCAHMGGDTISKGIDYGMTEDQVAAHLEHSQKILFRDDTKIISEGYDSVWGMKRRNIFTFENGKLVVQQNVHAGN